MNIREMREKTVKDLYKELSEINKKLTLLTLNLKLGKSKDIKGKKDLRKQIARIKTVISEKAVLTNNEEA